MELNECYLLLGVNSYATLTDIKKAFREKAKQYHPDKNPGKENEQHFIRITEAYDYLTQHKKNPNFEFDVFQDIINKERKKAQEEATQRANIRAEYARKKYEEFLQSDFYKNDQASLVVLNHLQFFILIALITLPIVAIFNYVFNLKWLGFFITFPVIGLFHHYYKKHVDLDITDLKNACFTLLKIKEIQYIGSVFINFFLFLNYPLNTYISFLNLIFILIFLLILSTVSFESLKNKVKFSRMQFLLVITPFAFNLLFILNYYVSFKPTTEDYVFKTTNSSMIELPNNKYKNQEWFRFFINRKEILNKNKVKYSFKKGALGLTVLRDIELY